MIISLFVLLATQPDPVCPEGMICIPSETYEQIKPLLKKLQYIEENNPTVELDGITLITDAEGRVFSNGTGQFPYKGKLLWKSPDGEVDFAVEFEAKQHVEIARKEPEPPPTWGLRFRVKAELLMLTALPDWFGNPPQDFADAVNFGLTGADTALVLEPFFVQDFNVQTHIGLRSLGVGLGMDLTKNFGVSGGVATTWKGLPSNPTISPFVGIFFSFN